MERSLSIFNFKKLPWGLILGIVLITCFEIVNLAIADRVYPKPYDGLRMKVKNEIALNPPEKYDVIILGDCYNLVGVNPAIIQKMTGLSAINFATHLDHTIFSSWLMWKNYLERSPSKPKYLIINYIPQVFVLDKDAVFNYHLSHFYEFNKGNFHEYLDFFGLGQTIRYQLPSLRNQAYWRKITEKTKMADSEKINDFKMSVYEEKGFYSLYSEQVYKGHINPFVRPYSFEPSLFFMKYFEKILELAEENGVKVIYPMFTAPPDYYKYFYQREKMVTKLAYYIESLKKRYDGIYMLNPQPILNKKEYYRDTVHLNAKGSSILSVYLAKALSEFEAVK